MGLLDNFLNNDTMFARLNALRLPAALVLIAVVLFNLDAHWFQPGLVVSAFGLVLTLWTFGSARGPGRLSVNGPYVFVRNPLAISRFILFLGLVAVTGMPWLLPVYVVLFWLWTMYAVRLEEEVLEEKEPMEYRKYTRHVPRFLPRLEPYPRGRLLYFRTRYFKRNRGLETLLVFTGVYILGYVITHYPA